MNLRSILYLGQHCGTALQRAHALRRLGHQVVNIDPYSLLPQHRLVRPWTDKTGALFLGELLHKRILSKLGAQSFDVVWVDSGNLVSPQLVRDLKHRSGKIINYNVDDPYGVRDGSKWRLYLDSVPLYDLVVVVRECNVPEAQQRGAKDVLWVYRSADEVAHAPRPLTPAEQERWSSQVVFVGTWMPERGPLLAHLVQAGVPLSLRGNRWQRAEEWPILAPFWKGPAVDTEEEYRLAVRGAAVCLGLLSKENRDLSTQRSFEIPYLGAVLCAERTSEHLNLYTENKEAVFWDDADECVERCKLLLKDEGWRKTLAIAGRERCIQNGTMNERILARILERLAPESVSPLASKGFNVAAG